MQAMSFSKPRFSKDCDMELLREASLSGYGIIGGKEKLLANAQKELCFHKLLSYSDNRFFDGSSYIRCGFKLVSESKPNYRYIKDTKVLSRVSCQKHKLAKLLGDKFDPSKTEVQNMLDNHWCQIFDYGNKKFVKEYK